MITQIGFSQGKFSRWNFDYQYNLNATMQIQHLAVKEYDSVAVFLKIQLNQSVREFYGLQKQAQWLLMIRVCESYESKNSTLEQSIMVIPYKKVDNLVFLKFKIPLPKTETSFLFIGTNTINDEEFVVDIPIKSFGEYLISTSFLTNKNTGDVIFDTYLKSKDTVVINNSASKHDSIFYFKYTFQAANPPMAENASFDAGLGLVIDSSFSIKNTIFVAPKKGNYTIGSIENKINKIVFDHKFPKPSKIKELIDPIIYIASDGERSSVKLATKQKQKLDDFWLKLGLNKEKTRNMIKAYYRQIQEANILFTGHKEGWKMDKGMIYIVFGPPEQVLKTDATETWYYQKSYQSTPIRFVFVKKYNPFGDVYFELQNDINFTTIWYKSVEIWRRGDNFR